MAKPSTQQPNGLEGKLYFGVESAPAGGRGGGSAQKMRTHGQEMRSRKCIVHRGYGPTQKLP
jgi:hypothetical protein